MSHGSTTPARNSSRRSSVKCGRPSPCATRRAPRTAAAEQHDRSPSFSGSAHSSSVTRDAHVPRLAATRREQRRDRAVDAAGHRDERAASRAGSRPCARTAAPSARCSASDARSAAWSLPALRPPSSAAICGEPMRATSSSPAPSASSTAALAAAIVAPQPEASKPAARTRSPSTATDTRTRSPQAAPPAAPSNASATVAAAAAGVAQVVLEALVGHGIESRSRTATPTKVPMTAAARRVQSVRSELDRGIHAQARCSRRWRRSLPRPRAIARACIDGLFTQGLSSGAITGTAADDGAASTTSRSRSRSDAPPTRTRRRARIAERTFSITDQAESPAPFDSHGSAVGMRCQRAKRRLWWTRTMHQADRSRELTTWLKAAPRISAARGARRGPRDPTAPRHRACARCSLSSRWSSWPSTAGRARRPLPRSRSSAPSPRRKPAPSDARAARLLRDDKAIDDVLAYTPYIVRGSRRSKEVALTFDDGPGPTTPALVRYLVSNGVPATFFLVGKAIAERPGIVRKQHEAGFALGSHTQNHARLGSKSTAAQSQGDPVGRRSHHADHRPRGQALPAAIRLVR